MHDRARISAAERVAWKIPISAIADLESLRNDLSPMGFEVLGPQESYVRIIGRKASLAHLRSYITEYYLQTSDTNHLLVATDTVTIGAQYLCVLGLWS